MRLALGILAIASVALRFAGTAEACSCAKYYRAGAPRLSNGDSVPTASELKRQPVVFAGTAVSQTALPPDGEAAGGRALSWHVAEFRVEEVWRGAGLEETVRLHTMPFEACGYRFEPGVRYVVFAHVHKNGILLTDICTRTAHRFRVGDLVSVLNELLGPSVSPKPKASLLAPPPPNNALQRTRFARR